MSATLSRACPSCGTTHLFYLAVGEKTAPEKHYRFTCPQTGNVAVLKDGSSHWFIVPLRPHGTVLLIEAQ